MIYVSGRNIFSLDYRWDGPLTRYVKLRFPHAPVMPGTFSHPAGFSDPDMHHGTCISLND